LNVILKKEFAELWRSKKILISVIVLAAMAMSSVLLTRFTPEIILFAFNLQGTELPPELSGLLNIQPTFIMAASDLFANIGDILSWVIILMTASAMNSEFINGTFPLYLNTKKIRLVSAKFVSRLVMIIVSVVLAAAVGMLYILVLFEQADFSAFLPAFLIIIVYAAFISALTLLYSCIFKKVIAAIGFSIFSYLSFSVLGGLPVIGKFMPTAFNIHIGGFLTNTANTGDFAIYIITALFLVNLLLFLSNCVTNKYKL
jgi:ABC-type transport system involved in multi-copper enzyme maturation permease subunit